MEDSGIIQQVLGMAAEPLKHGNGDGSGDNGTGSSLRNFDEHGNSSEPGDYTPLDGTVPNDTPITEQDIVDIIRNAQVMKQLGNNYQPGNAQGNIAQHIIDKHAVPTYSWKAVLRDMVRKTIQTRSFAKLNNRLAAARVVAPANKKQILNSDIIFAIDVSGSMLEVLNDVVNEVVALSRSTPIVNMRLLYWDVKVTSDVLVKSSTSLSVQPTVFDFNGGGGTNINCVYDYIIDKKYTPTGVVYLTDGYVDGNNFYTQRNCKNIVALTYDGNYSGMCKIKDTKGYTNSQLQVVRTDLGK